MLVNLITSSCSTKAQTKSWFQCNQAPGSINLKPQVRILPRPPKSCPHGSLWSRSLEEKHQGLDLKTGIKCSAQDSDRYQEQPLKLSNLKIDKAGCGWILCTRPPYTPVAQRQVAMRIERMSCGFDTPQGYHPDVAHAVEAPASKPGQGGFDSLCRDHLARC